MPDAKWSELSRAAKIWLVGLVLIFVAAKVHTFMTWDSGRYLESHWPFWAAIAGWAVLAVLIDLLVGRARS